MDIGELTAFTPPDEDLGDQCPFEHDDMSHDAVNELGGVGTKLGTNMANAVGTHVYQTTGAPAELVHKYSGNFPGDADKYPDPRDLPAPHTITHIYINLSALGTTSLFPYPLTCAAHHIMPAQESLKGHKILQYMCKKGEAQRFLKAGKEENIQVANAKVCGNVGYNINGLQNGVWLPGNYAVGGGQGGLAMWGKKKSRFASDPAEAGRLYNRTLAPGKLIHADWDVWHHDDEETPMDAATAAASAALPQHMLPGPNYVIDDNNFKWAYVDSAVTNIGGHFHDRHKDYSEKVIKGILSKLYNAYDAKYELFIDTEEEGCSSCKAANTNDEGVPPPYDIVDRLNLRTQGMITHLSRYSRINIYTSKWMQAKMNKVLQEAQAAVHSVTTGQGLKRKASDG